MCFEINIPFCYYFFNFIYFRIREATERQRIDHVPKPVLSERSPRTRLIIFFNFLRLNNTKEKILIIIFSSPVSDIVNATGTLSITNESSNYNKVFYIILKKLNFFRI